ncbi:MAG: toxic anion resistance protein [Gammaproteobacteria bacterium]|nr:toxic anion resistance protein [Gammaproteobacteria bacterium]MDH5652210.1 toxic anion resistance protein [Gammaproteobacteria bacterium]
MTDELSVHLPGSVSLAEMYEITETNGALTDKQVDALLNEIFLRDSRDINKQRETSGRIHNLGYRVQQDLARTGQLLKQPLDKLLSDAEDGGSVAHALQALQQRTAQINPNRYNFDMGTLRRLFTRWFALDTPLSAWVKRYRAREGDFQSILTQLQDGRGQLERDNITLRNDQDRLRKLTIELEGEIKLGLLLDKRIAEKLVEGTENTHQHYIENEIIYPLKQRIHDLQQQLAVSQQGIMTTEIIIRNNRELIRGIDRALSVTVVALNTAMTLVVALQTHKTILGEVASLNQQAEEMLINSSAKMNAESQAMAKQTKAVQSAMSKLKSAFQDVSLSLDDINRFRHTALPLMSASVVEMTQLGRNLTAGPTKAAQGIIENKGTERSSF